MWEPSQTLPTSLEKALREQANKNPDFLREVRDKTPPSRFHLPLKLQGATRLQTDQPTYNPGNSLQPKGSERRPPKPLFHILPQLSVVLTPRSHPGPSLFFSIRSLCLRFACSDCLEYPPYLHPHIQPSTSFFHMLGLPLSYPT